MIRCKFGCWFLVMLSALLGCSDSKAGQVPAQGVGAGSAGAHAGAGGDSSRGASGAAGQGASAASDGGTSGKTGPLPPFAGEGQPWMATAPKASCKASDMPDPGLQGLSANVRCNFEVVGHVAAPHFLSMGWYKDCAYVNAQTGTSVIDVSDEANPTIVTTLKTMGMQNNWESMKVHQGRGLLAGYQANGPVVDVYDVAADCKNPALMKSLNVGGSGHGGDFSTDGTIYYAASLYTSTVYPVDVTDPANPTVLNSMGVGVGAHDLFIGKQGNRGYFGYPILTALGTGSLAIVDLTQVQARAANPTGSIIKSIKWDDGNVTQYPEAVTYRGKDYLMVTDELGSGNCNAATKPQYGYARIFDISDEQNPTLVSVIKTEAEDPANCQAATAAAGTGFGVGTHYCNVDRFEDPRLLSCGLWSGGLRVYDIRNPWQPKEIAYFNPGGSDQVPGLTRILVKERRLWVATTSSGFYVLKFADGVLDDIAAE